MNNLVFFNKDAKKVCDNVNNFRSVWPPKVEDKNELYQIKMIKFQKLKIICQIF